MSPGSSTEPGPGTTRGPLARRWLPDGHEPDARFTLANERTFLAWIRTGLAFVAGGVAIEGWLATTLGGPWRPVLVVGLLVLGVAISAGAGLRWLRVERAMRRREPLPFPILVPLLVIGVLAASGVVLALVLTRAA